MKLVGVVSLLMSFSVYAGECSLSNSVAFYDSNRLWSAVEENCPNSIKEEKGQRYFSVLIRSGRRLEGHTHSFVVTCVEGPVSINCGQKTLVWRYDD